MTRTRSFVWNRYAHTYPLTVFGSCVFLFFLQVSRQNWLHLVPITVLAIDSGSAFIFWTLRLNGSRMKRGFVVLGVGYISRITGIAGFVALLSVPALALFGPQGRALFEDRLSVVFWLMWGFAFLELTHNHIYKLTHGGFTLEHVLVERRWSAVVKPLGGAIGQQTRRIRRQHARRSSMSRW